MQQRKRLLVLTKFQRWFLGVFLAYTAIFLLVFATGLFIWFKLILDEILNVAGLLSPTFIETLQKHMTFAILVIAIFLVILLAVAAMQALLFSRRIAGPIFALARHFDKCAETGKLEHLHLREGDLFVDIADKLNHMVDAVKKDSAS